MAAANVLVANYETLRCQVLGSQCAGGSSPGWGCLVRQGLAAWLQTFSLPTTAHLPAACATPVVALAGLQSEITNILITMVWSHYQKKPT